MPCVWLPYIVQCCGDSKNQGLSIRTRAFEALTPLDLNGTKLSCDGSPRVHAETKFEARVVLKDFYIFLFSNRIIVTV